MGDEKGKFNAVVMEGSHGNGLKVWRRVVAPFVSKTEERRHELFSKVNSPVAPAKASEVMKSIQDWEHDTRTYVAAGRSSPSGAQKRQIVVRRLPGVYLEQT